MAKATPRKGIPKGKASPEPKPRRLAGRKTTAKPKAKGSKSPGGSQPLTEAKPEPQPNKIMGIPAGEYFMSIADFNARNGRDRTSTGRIATLAYILEFAPQKLATLFHAVSIGMSPVAAAGKFLGVPKSQWGYWMHKGRESQDINNPFKRLWIAVCCAAMSARGDAEVEVFVKDPLAYLRASHRSEEILLEDDDGKILLQTDESGEPITDENGQVQPIPVTINGWESAAARFGGTQQTINIGQSMQNINGGQVPIPPEDAIQALQHLQDLGLIKLTGQHLPPPSDKQGSDQRESNGLANLAQAMGVQSNGNGHQSEGGNPSSPVDHGEPDNLEHLADDDYEDDKPKDTNGDIWQ